MGEIIFICQRQSKCELASFLVIGQARCIYQYYLPIYLIRVDERTKDIVILAEEETEILIYSNGKWRYL